MNKEPAPITLTAAGMKAELRELADPVRATNSLRFFKTGLLVQAHKHGDDKRRRKIQV